MKKTTQDRKKITINIYSDLLERMDMAASQSSFSTRQDYICDLLETGLGAKKFDEAILKLELATSTIKTDREDTRMEIKQLSNRINHAIDTLNKKIDETLKKQNSDVFNRLKEIQKNEVLETDKYKKTIFQIIEEMEKGRILERMATLANGIINIYFLLHSLARYIIENDDKNFEEFMSEPRNKAKKFMEERGIFADRYPDINHQEKSENYLNLSSRKY